MSDAHGAETAAGPLDSVQQLEQALETSETARAAADARLEAARSEASRLLVVARENAVAIAAERRRSVLAAADEEAAAIHRAGEAKVERLRADAQTIRQATVEGALAIVLPAADESEV